MTYREARMQAAKQLAAAGVENEAAESWFLMEAVCGISRSFYLLHEQEAMDPVQEQVYFALTRQRCGRMPLQYLTGEQEFMGLPFCVNEHVLIPRQDTEVLVEEAIRVIQKEMPEAAVLDLCTGSGCIGISIQSFCSNTQVTAADISEDALKVAQKNAKENQVPVEFVHSDLFKEISGSYDMIVSNPPYYVDSLLSPDEGRNTARHAAGLPFGELAAAVVRLLAPGGRFALVLPPVEMQRFRSAALGRLYPVRWTEVYSTPRRGVRRILAEFCTTPVPPPEPSRLVIELGGSDSYTEDYRRLTGDFYLKF